MTGQNPKGAPSSESLDFLAGGGEMGRLTRQFNWAATSLGPAERWPQSLKTALAMILTTRYPMLIWWGPELLHFYNDAYLPVLGMRHPEALGRAAPRVWAEAWPLIGPQADAVMNEGQSYWNEELLIVMTRNDYPEEVYMTFSYGPIRDDSGAVGGVFCACTEETQRVLGRRRLATLQALAHRSSNARTAHEACELLTAEITENRHDLPFALLYLFDAASRRVLNLAASTGLPENTPAAPARVSLDSDENPWDFDLNACSNAAVEVALTGPLSGLPGGPWPEPAQQALVLPMFKPGLQLAGFLVAGISPRRPLDEDYRGFLGLVAQQAATAVYNAQAHEEERRRAEALAEIDRAKTSFFTNVSHEFRTPLTLMLGPLEELAYALGPGMMGDLARTAQRNAERLLKLVNTLLDFARVEGGRADANFEPLELSATTADLASSFRSACERAGIALIVDCSALPQPVYVDRDQWEKIVLNLLSNAFKFTLEGEIEVRLDTTEDGQAARLRVRDTGSGIAQADMPKLFGRFQRIADSRGRSFEGSGIGLALVHELVKLHGGRIEAFSVKDRGMTFTVEIPFGYAHLPAEHIHPPMGIASNTDLSRAFVEEAMQWLPNCAASHADQDSGPIGWPLGTASMRNRPQAARILVADDNADMRTYLERLLSPYYTVETVTNGQEALARVQQQPLPDLVLADVMMPVLDGFQFIARLRTAPLTRTLVVIALSARAGEESCIEGLAAGADDYLIKPFSGRELLARVAAHLAALRLRREAVRGLHESEQRFRALTTATSDVVYCMNADWTQMRYLHGQEHIEKTADSRSTWLECYIPEDEQTRVASAIDHAVRTKSVFELEHRVNRLGGGTGWVFSRAIPILDDAGELVEWFGTAADVTQRKADEQALRDADRRKDEFLATLAHELRNPLAPIRHALHLMETNVGAVHDAGVLVMLGRQVKHLVRLVDDLMEASRISSGKLTLKCEAVDLVGVLRTSLEIAKPLIDRGQHTLTLRLPDEPLPVHGDAVRLAQVFGNLLNNAATYTEDGGHIELAARHNGECIEVVVADDGIGIDPAQLTRLFERFSQGNRGPTRSHGGLGIGLALVKQLVQLHGGTTEASSPGPGLGSRFIVRLPRVAGSALLESQPWTATGLQAQRILVVDDNRDAADSLGLLLQVLGAEVRIEHDGQAALLTAAAWQPAVVLLDLGMPAMDGFEVARRLRADPRTSAMKLVALTGWSQQEYRHRTQSIGFDHHLIKPVDINVLQTVLASLWHDSNGLRADRSNPA